MPQNFQHPKTYLLRRQLFELLQERGLPPHSMSVMNKLCAPSVGRGPPVACYSGRRQLYTPEDGLAWGESLLSPTKPPPLGERSIADDSPLSATT
jgi:hypothetical protein